MQNMQCVSQQDTHDARNYAGLRPPGSNLSKKPTESSGSIVRAEQPLNGMIYTEKNFQRTT